MFRFLQLSLKQLPFDVLILDLSFHSNDFIFLLQLFQLAFKDEKIGAVSKQYAQNCFPPDVDDHKTKTPVPGAGHHKDGGGAAKCDRVPPTEIFTNNNPMVAYLNFSLGSKS